MPNWIKNIAFFEGEETLLDELAERVKGEKSVFSFEKIIPVPDTMCPEKMADGMVVSGGSDIQVLAYITDGGTKDLRDIQTGETLRERLRCMIPAPGIADGMSEDDALGSLQDEMRKRLAALPKEEVAELKRLGQIKASNIEKYNAADWYEFCNIYWGTKWDASRAAMKRVSANELMYEFETPWNIPSGIYAALDENFPDVKITVCFADEDIGHNCGFIHRGSEGFCWPTHEDILTCDDIGDLLIGFALYVWEGCFIEDPFNHSPSDAEEAMDEKEFHSRVPEIVSKYLKKIEEH